jgi:Xaa-Pro aminopeptidase
MGMAEVSWHQNRQRLVSRLPDASLLVLFSGTLLPKSADDQYEFTPNRNFLYVTGLDRPNQALLVAKRGEMVRETVFVEPPDPKEEAWTGPMMTLEEAKNEARVDEAAPRNALVDYVARYLQGGYRTVVLDLERRRWDDPPSPGIRFAEAIRARYPGVAIENAYPVLAQLRRVKQLEEITAIRAAIACTQAGLEALVRELAPGRMEYELEAEFIRVLRSRDAHWAYEPIIASGMNATIQHYSANNRRIEAHELLLVDAAAEVDYYKADITRTFPVDERFNPRQADLYNVVWEAVEETLAQVRPGTAFAALNETARHSLVRGLKGVHVLRDASELPRYYYASVGHYLGLDTHDVGVYDSLEPGMVLTIEPGVYVREEAIGIRIEEDVLVTEAGMVVLSDSLPRERHAVEDWVGALRAG